jgi:hypothetical protein
LSLNLALDISNTSKGQLELVHVYRVPIGYHKTGKSYSEFAVIMKNHAEKDYNKFFQKHDFPTNIPCTYILTDDEKYAELAYDHANKEDIDLIVIGSRGRTDVSSILMGSVAEKLVYLDSSIPILIVKLKGENMGFLDALMKI